jgi:hypothetical protein
MATRSAEPKRTKAPPSRSVSNSKVSAGTRAQNAGDDFLASVMVGVSASLESMTEEERERAIAAAERSVSHLH